MDFLSSGVFHLFHCGPPFPPATSVLVNWFVFEPQGQSLWEKLFDEITYYREAFLGVKQKSLSHVQKDSLPALWYNPDFLR